MNAKKKRRPFSKQVAVRMPVSLHRELLAEAERERVSLIQLCVIKLSKPLAWYAELAAKNEEGRG